MVLVVLVSVLVIVTIMIVMIMVPMLFVPWLDVPIVVNEAARNERRGRSEKHGSEDCPLHPRTIPPGG